MRVVQEKERQELTYTEVKEIIQENLATIRSSFIAVGYYLKYVRDRKLYLEDGYQTIWEFAEDNYGLRKSTASRWMAINDRFSENGNSPLLADRYKDFGKSQLQEMLYLTDEQMEQAEPEMTAKEIRAIRKPEESQQENETIPKVELKKPDTHERIYFDKLAEHLINSCYDWFREDYTNRVLRVDESPKELKRKLGYNSRTWYFSVKEGVACANLFDEYVQLWDEEWCCIGNFDWFYLASAIQSQWNVVALKEVEEKQKDKEPLNPPEEPVAPAQQEPEIYEKMSERSDLELLQEEIQKENQTLEEMKGVGFGENDVRVRKQKLLVAALAGFACDLDIVSNSPEEQEEEPTQPELPILKNNEQRKAWLQTYKDWGLWYEDQNIGCKYYKYDFENGARLIAEVYPRKDKYLGEHETSYLHLIGTKKLIKQSEGKWNCHETYSRYPNSDTELVQFLKFIQKGKK